MEQELLPKVITAAGIFMGAGGLLIWFAKLMFQRLLKQYDEKLSDHEAELKKIGVNFTAQIHNLELKLVRLEPVVTSALSLRDDIKAAEGDIAVLEHIVNKKHEQDIFEAHQGLREIKKKLASSEH